METYKVDVERVQHDKKLNRATIVQDAVHVAATNRENAVYNAFDELNDLGFTVTSVGEVSMFDAKTETWHVIPSHRALSRAVA